MPLRRTIFVAGRPGRDSSCFDYVRFCLKFNSVGGHECKPEMKHLLLEQLPPCFVSFSCCTSSQPTCVDQKSSFLFGSAQPFSLSICRGALPCSVSDVSLDHPLACVPSDVNEYLCTLCCMVPVLKEENSRCGFLFPGLCSPLPMTENLIFVTCFMPGGVMNCD